MTIFAGEPLLQRRGIRKLTEVSRALTYAASIGEVFRLTVEHAAELLPAEQVLLMTLNDDGLLQVRASFGVAATVAETIREPMTEALVLHLAGLLAVAPARFLGVPLVVAGEVAGVLVVIRAPSGPIGEHDEWLLSALADQAAVALEKTRRDELGEFREQLIGIVGHDLRTPLGTIAMAAKLLVEREGLGERETELARKIGRAAATAARLIDQLLDLTRSRLGGGIPVDLAASDLTQICRQVVGEHEVTHPDRPLRVELVGDLTGTWDRDRLYQLLSNLVGNAVAHGAARTPIELRADGDEHAVVVEVANRGEPIPPAMLPHIFEAYRRKRTEHPSRLHGLGLGLFICQQIARAHGGVITVASGTAGTVFRVRLPRQRG